MDRRNIFTFTSNDDDSFPFQILNCPIEAGKQQALAASWVKPRVRLSTNYLHHQMLFAYISDATILQPALQPHSLSYDQPGLIMATMNHTIWFHRSMDMSDWTLIYSESPSTCSGRALAIANTFNQAGELLGTVAQEGILRQK
jgi:acyl-CoA thioesterase-2